VNVNNIVCNLTKQQQDFIKALLKKHNISSVLDTSRGSKELAFLMANWGKDVTSIEENAPLAQKAHKKNIEAGINLKVLSADMRDLSSVCRTRFDLITCMNSSLSYLLNEEDVWGTLAQMYLKLHSGGFLLIHTLDYDKLKDKGLEGVCLWEDTIQGQRACLYYKKEIVEIEDRVGSLHFSLTPMEALGTKNKEMYEHKDIVRLISIKDLNMSLAELGFERIENHDWVCHERGSNYFTVTIAARPSSISL